MPRPTGLSVRGLIAARRVRRRFLQARNDAENPDRLVHRADRDATGAESGLLSTANNRSDIAPDVDALLAKETNAMLDELVGLEPGSSAERERCEAIDKQAEPGIDAIDKPSAENGKLGPGAEDAASDAIEAKAELDYDADDDSVGQATEGAGTPATSASVIAGADDTIDRLASEADCELVPRLCGTSTKAAMADDEPASGPSGRAMDEDCELALSVSDVVGANDASATSASEADDKLDPRLRATPGAMADDQPVSGPSRVAMEEEGEPALSASDVVGATDAYSGPVSEAHGEPDAGLSDATTVRATRDDDADSGFGDAPTERATTDDDADSGFGDMSTERAAADDELVSGPGNDPGRRAMAEDEPHSGLGGASTKRAVANDEPHSGLADALTERTIADNELVSGPSESPIGRAIEGKGGPVLGARDGLGADNDTSGAVKGKDEPSLAASDDPGADEDTNSAVNRDGERDASGNNALRSALNEALEERHSHGKRKRAAATPPPAPRHLSLAKRGRFRGRPITRLTIPDPLDDISEGTEVGDLAVASPDGAHSEGAGHDKVDTPRDHSGGASTAGSPARPGHAMPGVLYDEILGMGMDLGTGVWTR